MKHKLWVNIFFGITICFGVGYMASMATQISVNTWYHVVCTRQNVGGTNKFRMYLNNSMVIDTAYNPTHYLWNYSEQAWGMSGAGHSHVYVSIARIYNKPLSDAEIDQNFEAHRGRFGI